MSETYLNDRIKECKDNVKYWKKEKKLSEDKLRETKTRMKEVYV